MKTFNSIKVGETFCHHGTQYIKVDSHHVKLADRGAIPMSMSPAARITP